MLLSPACARAWAASRFSFAPVELALRGGLNAFGREREDEGLRGVEGELSLVLHAAPRFGIAVVDLLRELRERARIEQGLRQRERAGARRIRPFEILARGVDRAGAGRGQGGEESVAA